MQVITFDKSEGSVMITLHIFVCVFTITWKAEEILTKFSGSTVYWK